MGWFSVLIERRTLRAWAIIAVVGAIATVLIIGMQSAFASHPEASLPGSNFEIDDNANLKVDDAAPSKDWANVSESRRNDLATGANDDSYSGGTKEDDSCSTTTTGSIPNNKSDLLTFGAYVEPEVGGPGFLNLFWTRVQEPSGTTLMDFELNQSSTVCANGVNPVRTVGDLLIEYRIEQGGARAVILVREWTGSAWGPADDLTAQNPQLAAGTINSTSIPAADSDGLSSTQPVSARTFGEAQLDLDFVFDDNKCQSFGSAFLKSRASTSFTSQLKDFIKPVPVNITNCGKVIIRKQTDPDENPNATNFGYTKSFGTDPATPNTFTLQDDGVKTFSNVLLGTGYTVTEDVIPSGWDFKNLDCSASTGVTPSINGATVTFGIDNASDVLDCTYTNTKRGKILIDKVTDPSGDPQKFDFTLKGGPSNLNQSFQLADQDPKHDSGAVKPGNNYVAEETVPADWELTSATCNDSNSTVGNIDVSPGETVTCTFNNLKQTTSISTAQSFTPQDTATITGTGSGTFNGQVDFELYKGEDCTGTPVYFERNVSLPGSGTVKATNGDPAGANHSAPYTISGEGTGEYHWKVSYHDDPNHPDATSCVEESTVTVDNDNTQP